LLGDQQLQGKINARQLQNRTFPTCHAGHFGVKSHHDVTAHAQRNAEFDRSARPSNVEHHVVQTCPAAQRQVVHHQDAVNCQRAENERKGVHVVVGDNEHPEGGAANTQIKQLCAWSQRASH